MTAEEEARIAQAATDAAAAQAAAAAAARDAEDAPTGSPLLLRRAGGGGAGARGAVPGTPGRAPRRGARLRRCRRGRGGGAALRRCGAGDACLLGTFWVRRRSGTAAATSGLLCGRFAVPPRALREQPEDADAEEQATRLFCVQRRCCGAPARRGGCGGGASTARASACGAGWPAALRRRSRERFEGACSVPASGDEADDADADADAECRDGCGNAAGERDPLSAALVFVALSPASVINKPRSARALRCARSCVGSLGVAAAAGVPVRARLARGAADEDGDALLLDARAFCGCGHD